MALKPVAEFAQTLAHGTEILLTAAQAYGLPRNPHLELLKDAPQILRQMADELGTPTGNRFASYDVLAEALATVERFHAASERFYDWTDDELMRVTTPGVDRF